MVQRELGGGVRKEAVRDRGVCWHGVILLVQETKAVDM